MEQLILDYLRYKRIAEEAKQEAESIKAAIVALMDGRETVTSDTFKVSYKPVTATRVDTKALKAAYPDIAKKFERESKTMRFTVR